MTNGYNHVRVVLGGAILLGAAIAAWSLLWIIPAVLYVEAIILGAYLSSKYDKKEVDRR